MSRFVFRIQEFNAITNCTPILNSEPIYIHRMFVNEHLYERFFFIILLELIFMSIESNSKYIVIR